MKRVGMEGSFAIAEAVKLADVDVVAAYPITPQTHIVERIAELVANGELNASYVPVESEHSAMSACLGSSAIGARTFTATAGQGLELMHEVLFAASAMRLPIIMVVANRALSTPLSVWGDHSDAMAVRDCGWIQLFAENVQQAYDLLLCAFRIGEHPSVLFPVMVHMDGFHLSHTIEALNLIDENKFSNFLPKYVHPYALDPENPVSLGAFGPPNIYTEAKKSQDTALRATRNQILHVWREFGDITDRHYSPIENYRAEDSDVLLITMGSFSENAMMAIDEMRNKGEKVGLVRIRLWRPFPFDEFRHSVKDTKLLIVMDRAVSFGGPTGPVCSEIQAALYPLDTKPKIISFVGGLGGRDVDVSSFQYLVNRGIEMAKGDYSGEIEIIGVRQ